MSRAMNAYLNHLGWEMIVSGPLYVMTDSQAREGQHFVRLNFLGFKKAAKASE